MEEAKDLWDFSLSSTPVKEGGSSPEVDRNLLLTFARPFHPVIKVRSDWINFSRHRLLINIIRLQLSTAFEKKFLEVSMRADFDPEESSSSSSFCHGVPDCGFAFRRPRMAFSDTDALPQGFELKLVNDPEEEVVRRHLFGFHIN